MSKVAYIHTNDGISVVLAGRPYHAHKDDAIYERVVKAIENDAWAPAILAIFEEAAVRLKKIAGLTPDMLYSGGVITYQGEVLHNYAADRLIALIEAGRDHKPLALFLERLQKNPSKRVVDNLYEFLEKGSIPLTSDGCFLAYKAVRRDYRDIHSGTFDNSVGKRCVMPRNRVDEDPNRTCSAGLHVCSFDYLPHFSHADGHVMVVKVDPAHVVAIPADYNATKMRVSEYLVVDEVHGYYAEKRDFLGDIGRGEGIAEPTFAVVDDESEEHGEYFSLEEAKRQAKRAYDTTNATYVQVLDAEDMVVWTVDESGGY